MKYFSINDLIFPIRLKNYFPIFQETFQKYSKNIPRKDKEIYCCDNVANKHFMKYFCNRPRKINGYIAEILQRKTP